MIIRRLSKIFIQDRTQTLPLHRRVATEMSMDFNLLSNPQLIARSVKLQNLPIHRS